MHLIIALIFPCKPIGNREDTPHSQPKQTMALDLLKACSSSLFQFRVTDMVTQVYERQNQV
jgi:hypothetical protein